MRKKILRLSILIIMFIGFLPAFSHSSLKNNSETDSQSLPFKIGETLVYNIRWEQIDAARATFQVLPRKHINNHETLHFRLDVKSNSFIDRIYKIRDRFDSYTHPGMIHSILYKKTARGKEKREIMVRFDWSKQSVQYSNFGKIKPSIKIPSTTFDPLSVFYKMRIQKIEPDKTIIFSVSDGKKCFLQKVSIIKKERITVPVGTFNTYVAIPELSNFGGIFKKSKKPKLKLWISSDEKHILVKMTSKVLIGSMIGELISLNQ